MRSNLIREARNAAELADDKKFRIFMGGFVQQSEALYADLRDEPTTDPKIAAIQSQIKTLEEVIAKPEMLIEQANTARVNAQRKLDETIGQGGPDDLSRG